MKVTILGCGGSNGVPSAGNNWGDCDPENPRNRRRRPSILVEWEDINILIDTSPDLREQLLNAGVARVDVVLYTHNHADHVHGIDDLRPISRLMKRRIDVFAESDVLQSIVGRFSYLFEGGESENGLYRPILTPHAADGPFETAGAHRIEPFPQDHGICASTGFRLGRFAYSTDVVELPDEAFETLDGVDTWIVDCLRAGPAHPTHAHLEKTLGWIERAGVRRAVLTHMNHQADYDALVALCPAGVEPAYDGMTVAIPGDDRAGLA